MVRELNDDEKQLIIKMYIEGKTQSNIARTIHCRETTIAEFLRNNGYKKRKRNTVEGAESLGKSRKHFFNELYFKDINSEDKAYWLGFLYADGNVYIKGYNDGLSKGGRVELTLKRDDYPHIKKFLNSISADIDYPIDLRHITLNDKTYDAYRVSLNSIKMCNDLISLGCVPNKSLTLKPPTLDSNLIPHFVRGYFDGDGCVTYNNNSHKASCDILGTKEILEYINDNIKIYNKQIICDGHNGKAYCLRISSTSDLIIFYRYIYENATISLNRKKEIYDMYYDYCLLNKNDVITNTYSDDPLIKYKKRGIPVVKISNDFSKIKIYNSAKEAYFDLFSKNSSGGSTISRCCKHLQKQAYGFYWLYYSEYVKYKDNIKEYIIKL